MTAKFMVSVFEKAQYGATIRETVIGLGKTVLNETNRENIVVRGEFFYAESVECKTKVLYTEKRPLAE